MFIVHREALEDPKHVGEVWAVVIERSQGDGADAFDVVAMEILVGQEIQGSDPAVGVIHALAVETHGGGVEVFDAASTGTDADEGIVSVRDVTDDPDPGFQYGLRFLHEGFTIKFPQLVPDKMMGNALGSPWLSWAEKPCTSAAKSKTP